MVDIVDPFKDASAPVIVDPFQAPDIDAGDVMSEGGA